MLENLWKFSGETPNRQTMSISRSGVINKKLCTLPLIYRFQLFFTDRDMYVYLLWNLKKKWRKQKVITYFSSMLEFDNIKRKITKLWRNSSYCLYSMCMLLFIDFWFLLFSCRLKRLCTSSSRNHSLMHPTKDQ